MEIDRIIAARAAAKELIRRIDAAVTDQLARNKVFCPGMSLVDSGVGSSLAAAALRRQSMELTRALAAMRKRP